MALDHEPASADEIEVTHQVLVIQLFDISPKVDPSLFLLMQFDRMIDLVGLDLDLGHPGLVGPLRGGPDQRVQVSLFTTSLTRKISE